MPTTTLARDQNGYRMPGDVELSLLVAKRQCPIWQVRRPRVSPGYFRLAGAGAQQRYDDVIGHLPGLTSMITLVCPW